MSSILKALKRLEEEKAERLDAPVDIARDILRQPRRRSSSMPWPALTIASIGIVVVAGFLVIWYRGQSVTYPDRAIHAEAVTKPSHSPLPPAAEPATETSLLPAVVPPEPEVVEVRMTPPPTVVAAKRAAARQAVESADVVASPEKTSPPVTQTVATPKPAPAPTAVRLQAEGPRLIVSGIVFQPEREARLAIVNDLPVMEGTLLEGAEVVEILVDRVRFDREGHFFEVEMVKAE